MNNLIDGSKITSLTAGICVTHLKPLVEAGRLYKAFPPLYKIVKNGKEIFIKDNKEYAKFLLNEIKKDIKIKGIITKSQTVVFSEDDTVDLIVNTKKYFKKLDKLSRHKLMEKNLLEYIIMNIHYLRDGDKDKFEKKMQKKFKQLSLKKISKDNYTLRGIYKREAEVLKINKDFYNDISELEDFLNNMPCKYFEVNGEKYQLAELLELIQSYEPKNKQRYKGKLLLKKLFNCWECFVSKSAA